VRCLGPPGKSITSPSSDALVNLLRGKSTRTSYSKLPCVYLVAMVPSSAVRTVARPLPRRGSALARARDRARPPAAGFPRRSARRSWPARDAAQPLRELAAELLELDQVVATRMLSVIASPELDVRRPRIRGGLTKTRADASPCHRRDAAAPAPTARALIRVGAPA
jgi:hypothetical protein